MTDTATRPAAEALPGLVDDTLPDEIQPAPPAAPVVKQELQVLPTSLIRPGPHNPRRHLGDLDGLEASIRAVGILEPLIVEAQNYEDHPAPGITYTTYLLLAGHRRLAAAKRAGLDEVPCIVRATAATPALRMEIALIENLQSEGLAPLDEADGYLQLTKLGLPQRVIAERVGCSQSHVSKRLMLLELPAPVQKRIEKGDLTLESAAALARLADHPDKLAQAAAGKTPAAIAQAVDHAGAMIKWEAKRDELVAVAQANDWPVVDEPKEYWKAQSFKPVLTPWYSQSPMDIDAMKHASEPCHAVLLPGDPSYPQMLPKATPICTDPDRHTPKGASTLKAKVVTPPKRPVDKEEAKREKQRLQDEADRKAANEARAAVITKALAEYRPKGRLLSGIMLTLNLVVDQAINYDGDVALAAELLGLEPGDDYGCEALERFAGSGDPQLQRAALALALAFVEGELRNAWGSFAGSKVAYHYGYLAELGYTPNPYERRKLDEAKASEAAEVDD